MSHIRWSFALAAVLGFAAVAAAEEDDDRISLVFVTCPQDDPDLYNALVEPFRSEYLVATVALGTPGEDARESVLVGDLSYILDQADFQRIVLVGHGWCKRITMKAGDRNREHVLGSIAVAMEGAAPMQTDPAGYEALLREHLAHLLGPPSASDPVSDPGNGVQIPRMPPPTAEDLFVPTIIQPIVAGNASVKRCLAQSSAPLPPEIRVRMNVHPDGSISDVTVEDEQVREAEVGDCVRHEIGRIMFPPFEGETTHIVATLEAP